MELLIIGYSSLVQRKILLSAVECPGIDKIHIASQRNLLDTPISGSKIGEIIQGYETSLKRIKPCLAYISLPNNMHYQWAKKALENGFHVIVDKPSVINFNEAVDLAELAEKRNLCLAEANAWFYHPMFDELKKLQAEEGKNPLYAQAFFSSPALNKNNFRLKNEPGSGIIYDRASYIISCGRLIYGGQPVNVNCKITEFDPIGNIDISCTIELKYSCGGIISGYFSLDADYVNSLDVISKQYSIGFDRVFTPPPDYEGPVIIGKKGILTHKKVNPANTFRNLLNDIVQSIENGEYRRHIENLKNDSNIMEKIILSSKAGG
jgi:dTDP-3,4-didehydro-2,6-dideoxy-alpha-D-glucose 3-reductase